MSTFSDFVRLEPREVPLGGPRGMTVHRTLPTRRTSLIGAWCFVDHFGPHDVSATDGMRVARHPHTGLATVSWLFEGAITHRDSLGNHALVRPGDVDLMVAGAGITHSEFSALDTTVLHGVQLWFALPDATRFCEREFTVHTPAEVATGTARARVGLGSLRAVDGQGAPLEDTSPVATATALGMAQLDLRAGTTLRLDLAPGHEHGILVDRGTARLTTDRGAGTQAAEASDAPSAGPLRTDVATRELMVLPDDVDHLDIEATGDDDLRLMLLSGEPLGEDIVMWWNFVGRTHEEIAAFRARYQAEIGVELPLPEAPIAEIARERAGLAEDAEQFGPFAPHTPPALPAPALPNGRLRSRGRRGLPA